MKQTAVRGFVSALIVSILGMSPGAVALSAQTGAEPPPIPAGRASPGGTYGDVDVLHYEVTIGLPAHGNTEVEADATLTLHTRRSGVATAFLDLTGLAVSEVTVDGVAVQAGYGAGRLGVPLPPGTTPGDTLEVRVRYSGTPDDGLILRDNVHGRPSAFVDNWPNRTRFWLPSVDHPSDKATAVVTVHAPASWRVISNGVLVSEGSPGPVASDGSPRRSWRWESDVAVSPYNMVFGASEMEVIPLGLAACGVAPASPREDGCVAVSAWLFEEDVDQAGRSFAKAAEMVDFYSEVVGPYPFQKLAHVQSATRFGGMENASAIFYSERGLAAGRNMEGTVAHETAHQWFGDSVTQVDWPELWLSEGFATYFGHLFFERTIDAADLRRRMEEDRQDILTSDAVNRPVIDREEQDLFALLNTNNYPKGGWVLHMLRGIVGDDAFFSGVRMYYARFAGGTVSTGDFQRAMEEVSGQELAWFFHQWLEEPGFPVLSASHRWDAATSEVVVEVRQSQNPAWPAFRLPMELELRWTDGGSARHRVELSSREQTFRFPASGAVGAVVIDPDDWVLHGPR